MGARLENAFRYHVTTMPYDFYALHLLQIRQTHTSVCQHGQSVDGCAHVWNQDRVHHPRIRKRKPLRTLFTPSQRRNFPLELPSGFSPPHFSHGLPPPAAALDQDFHFATFPRLQWRSCGKCRLHTGAQAIAISPELSHMPRSHMYEVL